MKHDSGIIVSYILTGTVILLKSKQPLQETRQII